MSPKHAHKAEGGCANTLLSLKDAWGGTNDLHIGDCLRNTEPGGFSCVIEVSTTVQSPVPASAVIESNAC